LDCPKSVRESRLRSWRSPFVDFPPAPALVMVTARTRLFPMVREGKLHPAAPCANRVEVPSEIPCFCAFFHRCLSGTDLVHLPKSFHLAHPATLYRRRILRGCSPGGNGPSRARGTDLRFRRRRSL